MAYIEDDQMVMNEIQKTVEVMTGQAPIPATLDPEFKKTFDTSSGLQPYNLEPFLGTLVPLLTPIRNVLPRQSGRGKQVEYKVVDGINTAGLNGFVAEGMAGQIVASSVSDKNAKYASMALADKVTYEQEWEGQPYVQSRALAVANLLRATMIAEERNILYAQNTVGSANSNAPGAVGTSPSPTVVTSGSGSGLSAGNVYVQVVAFTAMGNAMPSSEVSVSVADGENVVVTPVFPTNQPIVGFEVYAGSASGAEYLVTAANVQDGKLLSEQYSTNGAPLTITSLPTSGKQPSVYVTDNSASPLAWNGIIPQIFAGGGYTQNVGGELTDMGPIKSMFKALWDNAAGDPNVIYVHSTESQTITDLVLGNSNTPYTILVEEQNGAAGGVKVSRLINPQTASVVKVNTHRDLPQGMILALQTELPSWYPGAEIPAPIAMDLVQDYTEINYAPTYNNPGWTTEVRLLGTLKLYIPMLQGVLYGISPSLTA
ncbi:hypothetical protein [Alicyclobacillus acidoterrestris]|uniref:Uncharacterized protein n=1 Tax=Alicyclobacillus acidoterrestris (strain ATCC 49025 / DSM 3922 / CIP 106132 / NCIMB 13137 / GD3B) TaxID=1356854 RepID=T0DDB9_ALIAG|nr:hypothetical protein [Alicyclobacillus acidoterrestris]EPZ47641.1 hypothetical protein N007_05125 [Alicyclobacillus acidoterrestris ATCC 49025]UNO48039.1 hypothetical protein K1I37_15305 [Alicyclobacillus acidoterrestris]